MSIVWILVSACVFVRIIIAVNVNIYVYVDLIICLEIYFFKQLLLCDAKKLQNKTAKAEEAKVILFFFNKKENILTNVVGFKF